MVVRLLCEFGGGGKHSLTLAATQGISSHQVRFLCQLAQRQQHHVAIRLSLLGNVGRFWLQGARPHLLLLIVFIVETECDSLEIQQQQIYYKETKLPVV